MVDFFEGGQVFIERAESLFAGGSGVCMCGGSGLAVQLLCGKAVMGLQQEDDLGEGQLFAVELVRELSKVESELSKVLTRGSSVLRGRVL